MESDTQIARAKSEFRTERSLQPFHFAFSRFCEANGDTYDATLIDRIKPPEIFLGDF
jgi:hypothetical protein